MLSSSVARTQDPRAQYSRILSDSYIGLQTGYIGYSFSNAELENGSSATSIDVPHLSVRAFLFGHEFNRYFSAQVTYMRPVKWIEYQNVNGDRASHSVWMNVAGLSGKLVLPVTRAASVYGEGGMGIVTRKGFDIQNSPVLRDANFATILLGGGLEYRLNSHWSLIAGATALPKNAVTKQPRITAFSTGFDYTMRRLPAEEVERNSDPKFAFQHNVVQFGYSTNALGYGVNDFFSKGAVPIFFTAGAHAAHGFFAEYQRNVFHTRRIFSLDWGAGLSALKSKRDGEDFYTASVYPALRFTVIRSKPADLYVNYSLAGPTFISRTIVDAQKLGRRFTFQDFIGVGGFSGKNRHLNAEIRILHFSNGNLFPRNAGVTVPLSFNIGYGF